MIPFSKPIKSGLLEFLSFYLQNLYSNPLKTKALTSCTIASLGNLTAQLVSGSSKVNTDSIVAFGLFGLLFGGPVAHLFYTTLEKVVPSSSRSAVLLKFLIERFLYAPCYQMLSLYMLATFEGKSHTEAKQQLDKLYWTVLRANWKFLSLLQFINITFVPPMFRVLVVNMIGFFWSIFLATKRRQAERPPQKKKF